MNWIGEDDGSTGADRWVHFLDKTAQAILPSYPELTRQVANWDDTFLYQNDISQKQIDAFISSPLMSNYEKLFQNSPFDDFYCNCDSHYLESKGALLPRLRSIDVVKLWNVSRNIFLTTQNASNSINEPYDVICRDCGERGVANGYMVTNFRWVNYTINAEPFSLSILASKSKKHLRGLEILQNKAHLSLVDISMIWDSHPEFLDYIELMNDKFAKTFKDLMTQHSIQTAAIISIYPFMCDYKPYTVETRDNILYLIKNMTVNEILAIDPTEHSIEGLRANIEHGVDHHLFTALANS